MNHADAAELLAEALTAWTGPTTAEQLAEMLDLPAVLSEAFRDDPDHGLWLAVDTATLRQIAIRHLLTGKPTPTDLPCPAWCERGHGHPLSSAERGLFREHARRFGTGRLAVELVTTEYAATAEGPIVYGDPGPHLLAIDLDTGTPLTAAEARTLADNLSAAAEQFDSDPDATRHAR